MLTSMTTFKRSGVATGGGETPTEILHAREAGNPRIIKDLDLYPQPPTNTRSPTLNSEEPDNAMTESFWATLKTEYYYRRTFTTRDQVYTGVATWIEDFYNRRRTQTSFAGKFSIEYSPHHAALTTAHKPTRQ